MRSIPTYIENYTALTGLFEYWPSFHDSPVVSLTQNENQIDLILQVWDMTRQLDEHGYFILKNRSLVHFRFYGLSDVSLFHPQSGDILFELIFSTEKEYEQQNLFEIILDSMMDSSSTFKAKRGMIIDVSPCDIKGRKTEQGAAANP